MSSTDHEFKNLTLKDIRVHREKIQQFLDTTYNRAENAVENLFVNGSNPDVLENLDMMNTVLKECREKLATVANAIPDEKHNLCPSNQNQEATGSVCNLIVPKTSIVFNKPYLVEILSPGSPSRFWLKLESTSVESLEEQLNVAYRNCTPLKMLPCPGTFVVCLHSGKYCRGKVITAMEFKTAATTLEIILVDYGETITAAVDQLYSIQKSFCLEPAHGLLCAMHDLEPVKEIWEPNAILFFNQSCESIIAVFRRPPKEHENTETFLNYIPDYYVSLRNRDCKKIMDVAMAMIEKGMGKPFNPHPLSHAVSSDLVNNEPPRVQESFSESLSFEMEPKESLLKTNLSLKSSTLSANQKSKSIKSLNVDAQEFVSPRPYFVENKQQNAENGTRNRSDQDENLMGTKRTSCSGSANVALSSATDQNAKIRAIPLKISTTKKSSPATLTSNMVDDIDALLFVPPANRASPLQSYSLEHNSSDAIPSDVLFRDPPDPLLMKQFLDSDHQDSNKTPISLRYQYGSILKPRKSPALGNSSLNTLYCRFSHVISPTHFYVHLRDEISTIVKPLSERLNELYENSQPVPVTQPEVGSFWVVQEKQTNFWSRAEILSVETNDEIGWKTPGEIKHKTTCTVFLVDWGNVEVVAVCHLRPLVKEIVKIPCLALLCRLDGIYPFQKSENSEEWSLDATDKFIELAGIDQELTALFSSTHLDRNGALPLLMLKDGDDQKYSVNEQLVLLGFASSNVFQEAASITKIYNFPFKVVTTGYTFSEQPVLDDVESEWGDPMYDDYYSPMNTAALNTENYDSVTTGYIPKDEERICRFFAAKGSCYKGIKCDHLHSNERKNVSTEDKIEVYVHIPSLHLVSGSLVHVQVTCVLSAFRFYGILPHGTRNLQYASTDDEESETLESLQKALQEEYTTNYFPHRITVAPSAGDIVIARSPEDNKWYRGRVMEEGENDFFGIYFVDYGNSQLVHMRNICNPMPRFVHLPTQAVEMFLNGVETSAEANTIEAQNVLVSLIKNRDLVARVVHIMPFVCVDLYDTSGPPEIDVASEMIRLKVARKAKRKPFCLQKRGKEVAG
ncbi:LOW QUALITY PROTEIN: uncharacterized protein LOC116922036 [Daphnia magna]|uniref:LOW QUALITY PROTEIN: uncharacterized protein LOC116922036 n=1 Tax=Daphnia magna TaxID=35525 RepID=UPI001E1BBFE8|nr:LOW QUALITY PROTEIN: uncharacterized protein LOC116922036 [Daphnia magna]